MKIAEALFGAWRKLPMKIKFCFLENFLFSFSLWFFTVCSSAVASVSEISDMLLFVLLLFISAFAS